MTCHEFEAVVVDLARRELKDSKLGTVCWAHAANCPRCAERLLAEEKLTAGFEALAFHGDDSVLNAKSEEHLRREFRKQFALREKEIEKRPPVFQIPYRPPLNRLSWAWAAIAAALLAPLVVVLAERWQALPVSNSVAQAGKQSPVSGKQSSVSNASGAQPATAQQKTNGVKKTSALKTSHPAKGKKNSTPSIRPANRLKPNDEVASDFIPLPYGSGLGLEDGWQIVRMNVPRSDLAWLGVSLPNEQTTSGTVKADVVLGEDGLARAIRLVQE